MDGVFGGVGVVHVGGAVFKFDLFRYDDASASWNVSLSVLWRRDQYPWAISQAFTSVTACRSSSLLLFLIGTDQIAFAL
jgi:hypothetical protein